MRIRWLVLVLALLAAGSSRGAPIAWISDADGDWNDAGNWDAGVPTAADDVTIDRGAENPTVTHSAGSSSIASLVHQEALVVDGGTLDTGDFSSGPTSSVSVAGSGVRFSASGATAIDGAALSASGGGLLDVSAATSYSSLGFRRIQATGSNGAPSTVDLSGVGSLTGGQLLNQELEIEALDGGLVDLSGATSLADSSTRFRANGAGSRVDVSGLTAFVDTGPSLDISALEARDGGRVELADAPTTIDGYSILRDGMTSTLDTSQVTSLANSTVTVRGAGVDLDLSGLASFDTNAFAAEAGASLVIGASSYSSGRARALRATGTDGGSVASLIDATAVTSLTGGTDFNVELQVEASSGGRVDLSNVVSLADSSVRFRAIGTDSEVDLSSLTSFTDTGSTIDVSSLEAIGGGTIRLPDAPTSIDGYSIFRDGMASTLDTSQVTSLTRSTVTARGAGVDFELSGLGSFDGNSFIAESGASLEIGASSYSSGRARALRASGAASELDASAVTSLTGGTDFNVELAVEALSGGEVDLSNLASLADSSVRFRAIGTDSVVNLSSLASLTDTGASLDVSTLEAINGGTILLPTAPTSIDGYSILRSGAASTLDTSQVTSLTNSTVTASGAGVDFEFSGLGSFDGNSFIAEAGASLAIGSASYSSGFARRLRATGAASALDASAVTSLTGGTDFNVVLEVEALSGGEVNLSNLASLADSSVRFRADGADSMVDLSSLSSFTDTGIGLDVSTLEARGGGTVLLPSATPISIDGYILTVEGAGSTLDTSGVTSLRNSTAEAIGLGAVLDLSSLASADSNSFVAEDGARLDVAAASYVSGAVNQFLRAEGTSGATAALVDASGITSLEGSTGNAALLVDALEGGRVDLSGLAAITGGSVRVDADGAGSVVDLSALASFVDSGPLIGSSAIQASDGGRVELSDAAPVALTSVDLFATRSGTISGQQAQVLEGSRVVGEGSLDLGVVIDGGRLDPGIRTNDVGNILLNGDFELTTDGIFELDMVGRLPDEFDSLEVLATAILSGTIDVDFVSVFAPQVGDRFTVVSADTILLSADLVIEDDFGDGRFFVPLVESDAMGDRLVLLVAVPEPSTGLLLGLGLVVRAALRRRGAAAPQLRRAPPRR